MWLGPDKPYQELPPLPPEGVETLAVMKAAAAAREALAQVRAASPLMEDPTILINTVPLLEAQASSEIENIVTTNDELFRAAHLNENSLAISPATREALRYRKALRHGYETMAQRPFTIRTAEEVSSAIRGHQVQIRNMPGTCIGDPASRTRRYTPPEGRQIIEQHLVQWESFFHDHADIDSLVAMALLHYQFEAIHPFTDGNGRTGRILNLLFLLSEGLLDQPITYLSGYIIRNKDDYYRLLLNVTAKGEWEPWILFMLKGVEVTSNWTYNLILEVNKCQEEVRMQIASLPGNLPARDLVALTFRLPYLRMSDTTETLEISTPTARRYVRALVDAGILRAEKAGRTNLFLNQPFLSILFDSELPTES